MLRIGLTGGIGSGKTLVAELFRKRGIPVIDTDEIARELVRPGQPALQEIEQAFGSDMIDSAGDLNRKRLREIVFDKPDARRSLEAILHPRIRLTARARVAELTAVPYCIIVVPLLIETSFDALVDRILVVDTEEHHQIERAMRRDRLSEEMVRRIMAAQASREQRLVHAHDVILNNSDLEHLEREVERLDRQYRSFPRRNTH